MGIFDALFNKQVDFEEAPQNNDLQAREVSEQLGGNSTTGAQVDQTEHHELPLVGVGAEGNPILAEVRKQSEENAQADPNRQERKSEADATVESIINKVNYAMEAMQNVKDMLAAMVQKSPDTSATSQTTQMPIKNDISETVPTTTIPSPTTSTNI